MRRFVRKASRQKVDSAKIEEFQEIERRVDRSRDFYKQRRSSRDREES